MKQTIKESNWCTINIGDRKSKQYIFSAQEIGLLKKALEIAEKHFKESNDLRHQSINFAELNKKIKPIINLVKVYIPSKEDDV